MRPTRRIFDAIGHQDEQMHESAGINRCYAYAGPDPRGPLRAAVGAVTVRRARPGCTDA